MMIHLAIKILADSLEACRLLLGPRDKCPATLHIYRGFRRQHFLQGIAAERFGYLSRAVQPCQEPIARRPFAGDQAGEKEAATGGS